MMQYKGFAVWYNICQIGGGWVVQSGYDVHGVYKTVGGAKQAITKKWSVER